MVALDLIISFLSDWGYLALFICMFLENMNIPIPSEVILGFAGFLISQHIFTFGTTFVVGVVAGLAGSLASYYLGKKGGKKLIGHLKKRGGMGARKLEAAEAWFNRYGGIAVLTGRILPGVRTFISLPAGIAEFPLPRFIVYTVLGTVPWTLFLVYVGTVLGENWNLLLQYKWEIGGACIAIACIVGIAMYFWNKKHAHHQNTISQKEKNINE